MSFYLLSHPLIFFFFRLASNAFPDPPDWILGRSVAIKKKKPEKKSQEVLEKEALISQDDVKS